jgi:serine/threonine protein kinase/Tfp pilus assembly protein PilF
MIGKTVSHYRILEPLGEGGMGTVYLAEDTHLGRRVAIKFPSLSSDTHEHRARFLREARSISELSHPGIATLFDYGETDEGRPFLVMELARGRPLTELFQKGELTLARAVAIVSDVATALSEAHSRGVVHRDIKPSNIMIDDNGQVKVLDFGLAKQLNKDHLGGSEPEAQTLLSTETQSGVVLGTPAYLSPEQARGEAVDARSDLFALGTLLYEAITGRTPFAGRSFIEIAANVLHVEPPPPSKLNSLVPRELDFIVTKSLAKNRNKRYQSAKELVADLNSVKERLEEESGQTLIKRTSPLVQTERSRTLRSLSRILQRPRIPISYILIGLAILIVAVGIALRFGRPTHTPPAEAQRWYDIGVTALRDGASYQASQALQKAIEADDAYILAHARLAEALVDLDYVDRAKDELLRVAGAGRGTLSKLDSLYIDAITATARHDFGTSIELYKQIANESAAGDKAHALVDLGRAYENNNDLTAAIQSYTEATNQDSQYPTAYLRLGIVYGQQGDLDKALASFDKAESLYQALGTLEGRAEVVFQRGALLNKRNKLAEAKPQLEQALALAKANDNKSQTIKTLLQLCSLAFDAGETSRSTEYAQEAVDLAQKNGMENLSAQAMVDLGNSFVVRGEPAQADKYLTQALDLAQRSKARRNEARARAALGLLREQQNNFEEAIRYLEPALTFYEQGGYRSETFTCLVLLARANLERGDYASAQKSQEHLLQLAAESNDQAQIALAHAERGSALAREERFNEALDHWNQAYSIYSSQGIQRSMGYNLISRADVLAHLGRFDEAKSFLDQSSAIADKPGGELKRLSLEIKLAFARIALMQGNFPDARSRAEKVIEAAGTEFKNITAGGKIVVGLSQLYSGAKAAGRQTAAEAVEMSKQLNDSSQLATAQLSLAEALLLTGDGRGAASNALQAEDLFVKLGQPSSGWQALVIAARASESLADKTAARDYSQRAKDSLSKLEQRWGSENYKAYLSRPDVQRFRKQLEQLTGS